MDFVCLDEDIAYNMVEATVLMVVAVIRITRKINEIINGLW